LLRSTRQILRFRLVWYLHSTLGKNAIHKGNTLCSISSKRSSRLQVFRKQHTRSSAKHLQSRRTSHQGPDKCIRFLDGQWTSTSYGSMTASLPGRTTGGSGWTKNFCSSEKIGDSTYFSKGSPLENAPPTATLAGYDATFTPFSDSCGTRSNMSLPPRPTRPRTRQVLNELSLQNLTWSGKSTILGCRGFSRTVFLSEAALKTR